MKKYGIIGIVFVGVAVICAFTFRGHKEADYLLTDFPAEADPVTVGNKIADRFLEQWHSQYGSPLRVDEPRTQITYPDVCTWLGGLWFAQATKNRGLEERLEARFQPLFTTEAYLQPQANHVDNNVFGAVPLELYMRLKMKSIWQGYEICRYTVGCTCNARTNRRRKSMGRQRIFLANPFVDG